MSVSNRPRARGAERFAGLGPVGDGGVECVDAKRHFRATFVAHVRFSEVAETTERLLVDARWQDLVPAVEIADFHRFAVVDGFEDTFPDEAEPFARAERPAETQSKVVVDFLKDDADAVNMFVEVALEPIDATTRLPGFP